MCSVLNKFQFDIVVALTYDSHRSREMNRSHFVFSRFRKENAKLIEALLHRDDEDSSVTDTVLAQICMCEVSDLPTLLQ